LRSAQANTLQDPISKITRAKMHWKHGSSCRAPALQVAQALEHLMASAEF
jgi:hypothetical protein